MTYKPEPLNTDDIILNEDIMKLVEQLAENTHDIWATNRIKDGWSYGSKRNDDLKQNPCLVPYKELPEEEKVYDRDTAIETLKMIVKIGYTIEKV